MPFCIAIFRWRKLIGWESNNNLNVYNVSHKHTCNLLTGRNCLPSFAGNLDLLEASFGTVKTRAGTSLPSLLSPTVCRSTSASRRLKKGKNLSCPISQEAASGPALVRFQQCKKISLSRIWHRARFKFHSFPNLLGNCFSRFSFCLWSRFTILVIVSMQCMLHTQRQNLLSRRHAYKFS